MLFSPRKRRTTSTDDTPAQTHSAGPRPDGHRTALRTAQATQAAIRNSTEALTAASRLRAHQVKRLREDGVSVQDIADALGIQASKVYRMNPETPEGDEPRSPHYWDGTVNPDPFSFALGYDAQTGTDCTLTFPAWHGTVLVGGGGRRPDSHGGMLAFDALLAQAVCRHMPWDAQVYPEVLYLAQEEGLRRFSGRRGVHTEDVMSDGFEERVLEHLGKIRERLTARKQWRQAHYPDTQNWAEVPEEARKEQGFTPLIVASTTASALSWHVAIQNELLDITLRLGKEGLLCFAHVGVERPAEAFSRASVPLAGPVHSIEFGMGRESLAMQSRTFRFLDDPEPWAKSASWGLGEDECLVKSPHGSMGGLGVRPVVMTSFLDGYMAQGKFTAPLLDWLAPLRGADRDE